MSFRVRTLLSGVLCGVWCLTGCSSLDPVYTDDLCGAEGVISSNCARCKTAPYSLHCPQCQGPTRDPQCENAPTSEDNPRPGAGGAGSSGSNVVTGGAAAVSSSGGAGAAGQSQSEGGTGAAGATAGTAGSAGSGAEPAPPEPTGCTDDASCPAGAPACGADGKCVRCLEPKHCGEGQVCKVDEQRCVECTMDVECTSGNVCTSELVCEQCERDEQCKDEMNPTLDACTPEHVCVDCVDERGCEAGQVCLMNACVECASDDNCQGETKAGKNRCTETNVCVECLESADCEGETPVCAVATNTCVECVADADCRSASASHCSAENKCVPCQDSTQCSHLSAAGKPLCEPALGECVTCLAGEGCGDYTCILSTRQCSQVRPGELASCEQCETDLQCQNGHLCVALDWQGVSVGKRCVPRAAAGSSGSCRRPFREDSDQTSVDGVRADVCVPPPNTTCQGVLDARNAKPCGTGPTIGSTACGQANLDDGDCLDTAASMSEWRCSYICEGPADCEGNLTCTSSRCQ
ncbi:MAG: hypothetical protein ABW321_06855 [Polyangiales bacterium]